MTLRRSVQTTTDTPLGVVIIEDIRDVREGLSVLINGTAGFRCTGAYRTMEEALARVTAQATHVILTDIGLPGMSGIDGIRALRERLPEVPILALTVYDKNAAAMANLVAAGATAAKSAREVADKAEVLLTCLPGSPEVESLYLGADGLIECAKAGNALVDMSSVLPSTPRKLEPLAKARGVQFLEAPVSGGVTGARAATLRGASVRSTQASNSGFEQTRRPSSR